MLHLAGGVAFGVDVGDFLQLQRAFQRDGEVNAAAEEEEILHPLVDARQLVGLLVAAQHGFQHAGQPAQLLCQFDGLFIRHGTANLSQPQSQQKQSHQLRGEGLRAGHSNLRPGVGVDGAIGLAGNHRAHHVADGDGLGPARLAFALRGNGVGGLAALRDDQRHLVLADQRIAIAELAGVVHLDRHARQPLDHVFSGQSGVPACAAGGNVQLAQVAELFFADVHLLQKDLAAVL